MLSKLTDILIILPLEVRLYYRDVRKAKIIKPDPSILILRLNCVKTCLKNDTRMYPKIRRGIQWVCSLLCPILSFFFVPVSFSLYFFCGEIPLYHQ